MEEEWLEVNECGGYASSTILNCHSRKYHGLFIANLDNPGGRFVLLSKCEDFVSVDGKELPLSIHRYPGVYYPHEGHALHRFVLDLFPRFIYHIGDSVIEKNVMFVRGEDTLLLRYYVNEVSSPVALTVRPLLAFRDIHTLTGENDFLRPEICPADNGFFVTPYDAMPTLFIQANEMCRWYPVSQWYRNFEYPKERDRGFSYHEDLFMPGAFECVLPPGEEMIFRVSMEEDERKVAALWRKEVERRIKLRDEIEDTCGRRESFDVKLRLSSRDFVIRNRKNKLSIIAGYHWFYEWGRDALISLPGLTFHAGRVSEGIEILNNIGDLRRGGLIPNNISEKGGENAYNSADASLWYFWCVQELLGCTGNREVIMKKFWPILIDIAHHFYSGAIEHIHVLENGLVTVGSSSTQLTWMDAMVNGMPVTPRHGCPVEINALWFNALCFIRNLARQSGEEIPFDVEGVIEKIEDSFDDNFWIPGKRYLADRWIPEGDCRDDSMRPNQLLAVSLPFAVVADRKKAADIVRNVSEKLLTPYGLRTLSPDDSRFKGRYAGSPEERDAAYHEGTVWPWLLGHYGEALLKTAEDRESARKTLYSIMEAIERHLGTAGVGYISEIFNGDPPFEPCGCIAQAWSIAEVIRLRTLLKRLI